MKIFLHKHVGASREPNMAEPDQPQRPLSRDPGSLVARAWEALGGVYDPELCMDIVSLGLVYEIKETGAGIEIKMTLTTPGCPASESLVELAGAAVSKALGQAVAVVVDLVWDPPWSPDMIRAAAGPLRR